MKSFKHDADRLRRCGLPEVVYGGGKSVEDVAAITRQHLSDCGRVIFTKLDEEKAAAARKAAGKGTSSNYDGRSQVLIIKKKDFKKPKKAGAVGILTAGTSDIPVAEEARIIAEELGLKAKTSYDVGVAGIHRLYPALDDMSDCGAFIVAAGMEGALPSVVAGLVGKPVIGVPTSVGYGVGAGGWAALNTMLNSCAPVAVVNIDNGYGAAVLAYQIIRDG